MASRIAFMLASTVAVTRRLHHGGHTQQRSQHKLQMKWLLGELDLSAPQNTQKSMQVPLESHQNPINLAMGLNS